MSLNWLRAVPREDRFEPRVDGQSLVLNSVSGEEGEAKINDAEMTHDQVVVWRGTSGSKRFKTTGVSNAELQVLNGVTAGSVTAGKAVIASSGRDITNIRNLHASGLNSSTLNVTGHSTFHSATFANTVTLNSDVISTNATFRNIKVGSIYKYQLLYGSTARDIIRRHASSSVIVYLGNTSDTLKLETSTTFLYHRRAGTDYKVWTEHSDGAGSGLNADMVDSIHAASFLRSDANDEWTGLITARRDSDEQLRFGYNRARSPYFSFWRSTTRRAYIQWNESSKVLRLYNDYYDEYLDIGNGVNGLTWKGGHGVGTVWHSLNQGSGSGLDADTLDSVHASSFIRSDQNGTFNSWVTGSALRRPFYASNTTSGAKFMMNHPGSYYHGIGNNGSGRFLLGLCNSDGTWRTTTNNLEVNFSSDFVVLKGSREVLNHVLLGDPAGYTSSLKFYVRNDSWNDLTMLVNGPYTSRKYVYIRNLNVAAGQYEWRNATYKLYVGGSSYTTGSWTSSDARRKKEVKSFVVDNVLEKLGQMRPVTYKWKKSHVDDGGLLQFGFIAQEVEKLFPNLVHTDVDGFKAMAYDKVPIFNMLALKELYRKLVDKGIID